MSAFQHGEPLHCVARSTFAMVNDHEQQQRVGVGFGARRRGLVQEWDNGGGTRTTND